MSVSQHSCVDADPVVIGDLLNNELLPTHPLYNVPPKCVWQSFMHFLNSDTIGNDYEEHRNNGDEENGSVNGH